MVNRIAGRPLIGKTLHDVRVVGVALTDVKEIVVSGRNYDVVYIEDFRTHRIEKVLVQSIEFKDSLFKNPDGSPVEIVVKEE